MSGLIWWKSSSLDRAFYDLAYGLCGDFSLDTGRRQGPQFI